MARASALCVAHLLVAPSEVVVVDGHLPVDAARRERDARLDAGVLRRPRRPRILFHHQHCHLHSLLRARRSPRRCRRAVRAVQGIGHAEHAARAAAAAAAAAAALGNLLGGDDPMTDEDEGISGM